MSRLLLTAIVVLFLTLLNSTRLLAADDEAPAEKVPGYISLGKPMVLNLSTDSRRLTFLQVAADVLVKDEGARELVEKHVPAIRHKIILMLSEQPALDMKSPIKREEIRKQVTVAVRDMIETITGNKDIEEVLFSTFLVQ